MPDIFVSYSQRDKDIVRPVAVALQERGASLRSHSMEKCDYFMLALSSRAAESSRVRAETASALLQNKKLCVLIIEETTLNDFLFTLDIFTVRLTRSDQTNDALNELAEFFGVPRAGIARLPEEAFIRDDSPDEPHPADALDITLTEAAQQAMFFTATEISPEKPGHALFLYRFLQQYAPEFAHGRLARFVDEINQRVRQTYLIRLETLAEDPSKRRDWQALAVLVSTMRGIDLNDPITTRWQYRLNEGFLNDFLEQAKALPIHDDWTTPNPILIEILKKMETVSAEDGRTHYVRDRLEAILTCHAIYTQAKTAHEANRSVVVARLMNFISTNCPDYGDPDHLLRGTQIRADCVNNVQLMARLEGHTAPVQALAFSPDNTLLVSGGGDGTLRLWDMVDLRQVAVQRREDGVIDSLAFSQDGQFLVSASRSSIIRIWSMPEGREAVTLDQFRAKVTSAIFTQDASALVCGYDNGHLEVIDINTGTIIAAINAHRYAITRIHFSSDYRLLFTASEDRTSKIWTYSPTSQDLIMAVHTLHGHLMLIQDMAVSLNNSLVATVANDGQAKVWNVETGTAVVTLPHGEGIHVRTVAFSADGSLIITGGSDRHLTIWQTTTGSKMRTLAEHSGAINTLAITPDGTTLASGASDRQIHIWRLG